MTTQNKDGQSLIMASVSASGAVTASDTTVLDFDCLYVGTTGDISVTHIEDGTATVFASVPVGFFPVSGVRVNSTSTTASNIVWCRLRGV